MREAKALQRTSRPKTPISRRPVSSSTDEFDQGFSLIELMVVIAIMGVIFGVALPSLSRFFGVSINTTTREMATTIRDTFNAAVVTGRTYRLVYDFEKKVYWAEVGAQGTLVETEESRKADERRSRLFSKKREEKNQESSFSMAKAVTRKPIKLPLGISFDDVLTQASKDPVTSGRAYTHFFPHGVAEQTIIRLKDNSEHKMSLVIQPTNGQTDVYSRYLPAEEAFPK